MLSSDMADKVAAAIKKTEYKYFGDYEMSDDQREAVDVLVEAAQALLSQVVPPPADAEALARLDTAEVDRIALLLKAAWDKAEPDHGVTLHPVSYIATFADMARVVVADHAIAAAQLRASLAREAALRERVDALADYDLGQEQRIRQAETRAAALERQLEEARGVGAERKFSLADRVEKIKGSSWRGHVVGFYSTAFTPIGYDVESEREPGSVQIYPEAALRAAPKDTAK